VHVKLSRAGRLLKSQRDKSPRAAPPSPRASLGCDERDRLGFRHHPAAILAVRSRQRCGELEPDNLAANDGGCIHDSSVRKESDRHKRMRAIDVVRSLPGRKVSHVLVPQPPEIRVTNSTHGTEA